MSEIIRNTLMITGFVFSMMMLLEYITILTRGRWSMPFQKSEWLQIIFASFLGLIPGCLGTYTVVSLYIHRTFRFSALLAAMISTIGDEAYILLSSSPATFFNISLILFVLSLIAGGMSAYFFRNKSFLKAESTHYEYHEGEEECFTFKTSEIVPQLKNISFQRAILIGGLIIFFIALLSGSLNHEHGHFLNGFNMNEQEHHSESLWLNITALITTLVALFIVSTVSDHYLQHHLWEHLLKKHFMKIFIWIFATLLVIHFVLQYFDVNRWVEANLMIMIVLAVLIGIIPQSGPHIVFITLFLSNIIPFSVLLANSVVQDGHGALPLLAESKKSFAVVKLIKVITALILGFSGYYFGF
ncbi:MAG: arsenic efflux protein [Sphingobacteriales bacterium]|nr:arsenic efflux protein [Sphingobacteriales bacterium]